MVGSTTTIFEKTRRSRRQRLIFSQQFWAASSSSPSSSSRPHRLANKRVLYLRYERGSALEERKLSNTQSKPKTKKQHNRQVCAPTNATKHARRAMVGIKLSNKSPPCTTTTTAAATTTTTTTGTTNHHRRNHDARARASDDEEWPVNAPADDEKLLW